MAAHQDSSKGSGRDCRCCSLCTFDSLYRSIAAPTRPDNVEGVHAEYAVQYACQRYPDSLRLWKGTVEPTTESSSELGLFEALKKTRLDSVCVALVSSPSLPATQVFVQGLGQIRHCLQRLCIQSMQHVPMLGLSTLIKQATVLQGLELVQDVAVSSAQDLVVLAQALSHHHSLSQFSYAIENDVVLPAPMLDPLGRALLEIPYLNQLSLGGNGAGSVVLGLSPLVLQALVQHPALTVLVCHHLRFSRAQCLALAEGLAQQVARPVLRESAAAAACDGDGRCFVALDTTAGLLKLDLKTCDLSEDASWTAIVASIERHSTLRSLNLEETWPVKGPGMASLAGWQAFCQRKRDRTSTILQVLQENAVLQEVHMTLSERDEEIKQEIDFYLSLNRLGVRRLDHRTSRAVWGQAAIAMACQPQFYSASSPPGMLYFLLRERPDLIVCNDEARLPNEPPVKTDHKMRSRRRHRLAAAADPSRTLQRGWQHVWHCVTSCRAAGAIDAPLDTRSVPSTEPTMLLAL